MIKVIYSEFRGANIIIAIPANATTPRITSYLMGMK